MSGPLVTVVVVVVVFLSPHSCTHFLFLCSDKMYLLGITRGVGIQDAKGC